ncbi:MAG: tetratricopeptide repeat protein [Rhodospirillaceae bacterium]|nr:tetratricopeptide repeat protein [Rhodospirillaceae bacterium]
MNRLISHISARLLAAALTGVLAFNTVSPAGVAYAAEQRVVPGPSPIGNYLAGRHAQSERDLDAAVTYLSAALGAVPNAPDLLRRTFVLMTIEGRINEALPLAKRLVKKKSKTPIANLALAVEAIKKGDDKLLQQRLKSQPAEGINGFTRPVMEAWSLAGAQKPDAALKALKPLDGNAGSQGLYDMHHALILDFAGREKAAEAAYQDIAKGERGPSFRLVQHLGRLYERNGRATEAKALYQRYVEDTPGTALLDAAFRRLAAKNKPPKIIRDGRDGAAEALFNIANSLRQQRARETALVLGRLALWLKPKFPIAQIMVADILEDDQRYLRANAIYKAIGEGSAFRNSADLRRALNLNALKQTDAAITLMRSLTKKRATDPQPVVSLGDLLRRHERWDGAIDAYTEAIKRVGTIEKRHWRMLYTRGIVLERAKRWEEAEKDFLKALEFEPEQPYVLNYLGYSWVDRGINLERAQDMIRTAVKRRPNDGYIIDSLGWVYYRIGKYKKAVLELERAVQIRPEDPVINDHLGDAYWRVGRKLEAQFQWTRSLSLKPNDEVAAEVRKKLKDGLAPAKPVGVPEKAGETSAPDKT